MQNTEGGRKLNQAMVSTGRAVATTGRAVGEFQFLRIHRYAHAHVHSPCFYKWLQGHCKCDQWCLYSVHSFYMVSASLCFFSSAFNKFELHLLVEVFHFCFIPFIFPLIFFFVNNHAKWSQQLVQTEKLTHITPSDMCALCVSTVFSWVFLCEYFCHTVHMFLYLWHIPRSPFILTKFGFRECNII
jgi:hypothetical protein